MEEDVQVIQKDIDELQLWARNWPMLRFLHFCVLKLRGYVCFRILRVLKKLCVLC